MASEIKVDTISEKTSANGVTIDSVSLKDGKVATANSIDSDAYVDGSIDTAHIADDQITLAKMASGTDGNIISYDASGNPVAIATGNDGQVLTSTGAGSPPAFEAAPGGGKIHQVVQSSIVTSVQSTTSTSYVDMTNLTLNITPSATSSKILLIAQNAFKSAGSSYWTAITILRDSTDLGQATYGLGRVNDDSYQAIPVCITYFDSPSSTSQITYKMQFKVEGGTAYSSFEGAPSQLTAMEILA